MRTNLQYYFDVNYIIYIFAIKFYLKYLKIYICLVFLVINIYKLTHKHSL